MLVGAYLHHHSMYPLPVLLQPMVARGSEVAPLTRKRFHIEMRSNVYAQITNDVRTERGAQVAHVSVFERMGTGHGRAGSTMFDQRREIGGAELSTMNTGGVLALGKKRVNFDRYDVWKQARKMSSLTAK
uniref:Uncharacterized protein n=1 Tax=Cacopsylla melanoneura TaxID=428564 RepID=A0A8D9AKH8_9HEMI